MSPTCRAVGLSAFSAMMLCGSSRLLAAPLSGSGAHLPLPTSAFPAMQDRTLTAVSPSRWIGSWSAPAAGPWVGSYQIDGNLPSTFPGQSPRTGESVYDFRSMPGGELPIGTFFVFYDLDLISGDEYRIRAFDSNGALITTPWLDEPVGVRGSGGGGSPIALDNMPRWAFGSGTYFFDPAGTSPADTDIEFALTNNTAIATMRVFRSSIQTEFRLAAPLAVPGAGTGVLAAVGFPWLARRRRPRR